MRVIQEKINAADNTAYVIQLAYSEVQMLYDLVDQAQHQMPKFFETSPARNRLKGLRRDFGRMVAIYKAERPGYYSEDFITSRT